MPKTMSLINLIPKAAIIPGINKMINAKILTISNSLQLINCTLRKVLNECKDLSSDTMIVKIRICEKTCKKSLGIVK